MICCHLLCSPMAWCPLRDNSPNPQLRRDMQRSLTYTWVHPLPPLKNTQCCKSQWKLERHPEAGQFQLQEAKESSDCQAQPQPGSILGGGFPPSSPPKQYQPNPFVLILVEYNANFGKLTTVPDPGGGFKGAPTSKFSFPRGTAPALDRFSTQAASDCVISLHPQRCSSLTMWALWCRGLLQAAGFSCSIPCLSTRHLAPRVCPDVMLECRDKCF